MADRVDPRTGELVTTNYGWTKPTVGASTDAWGGYLNTDLDGIDSTVFGMLPKAGGTMTGAIVLSGNAASALQAVPLQQLTSVTSGYLPLTGGTLTGALTPSQTAGLVGTTTNNNAAAGAVGEFMSSIVSSPGATLTTGAAANVTSLSLTAGDWDVWGEAWVSVGTGGSSGVIAGLTTTSGVMPAAPLASVSRTSIIATLTSSQLQTLPAGKIRLSLAATTSVYLVALASFPSGTTTAFGSLSARRRR